jgi:hypothetical protein
MLFPTGSGNKTVEGPDKAGTLPVAAPWRVEGDEVPDHTIRDHAMPGGRRVDRIPEEEIVIITCGDQRLPGGVGESERRGIS